MEQNTNRTKCKNTKIQTCQNTRETENQCIKWGGLLYGSDHHFLLTPPLLLNTHLMEYCCVVTLILRLIKMVSFIKIYAVFVLWMSYVCVFIAENRFFSLNFCPNGSNLGLNLFKFMV